MGKESVIMNEIWKPHLQSSAIDPDTVEPGFTLSLRASATFVSIFCIAWYTVCVATDEKTMVHGWMRELAEMVDSMKTLLLEYFFIANLGLLIATVVDSALLVHLYIYYTIAFVIMGLLVTLVEFLLRTNSKGITHSVLLMLPDVVFFFVLYRCLPILDSYARELEE